MNSFTRVDLVYGVLLGAADRGEWVTLEEIADKLNLSHIQVSNAMENVTRKGIKIEDRPKVYRLSAQGVESD